MGKIVLREDDDCTAVTTESTDDPAILKQQKMMAAMSSSKSPSSPGAHQANGSVSNGKKFLDTDGTGGHDMPKPMPEEELSPSARRRLRCCFCSCWLLAMVMAGLTAFFALGGMKLLNKKDASASSSTTAAPQVIISSPLEKMNFVLQAMLGNNMTSAYVEMFPDNIDDLKGKAQDAEAHAMIRAMSWLVHDDSYDQASELVQRFALAAIYYTSGGEKWTDNKNWLSKDTSICSGWFGVACCGQFYNDVTITCANRNPNEIAEIDLHDNNLHGAISDAFALLSELHIIWLDNNKLTGPLKGDLFGKFPYLNELYVQHNQLSGPIEGSLRDNKALQTLFLQGNDFDGESPAQFCRGCGSSNSATCDDDSFVAFGVDCDRNDCPEDCCLDAYGYSRRVKCYNSY